MVRPKRAYTRDVCWRHPAYLPATHVFRIGAQMVLVVPGRDPVKQVASQSSLKTTEVPSCDSPKGSRFTWGAQWQVVQPAVQVIYCTSSATYMLVQNSVAGFYPPVRQRSEPPQGSIVQHVLGRLEQHVWKGSDCGALPRPAVSSHLRLPANACRSSQLSLVNRQSPSAAIGSASNVVTCL